jgi:hypothetical protein
LTHDKWQDEEEPQEAGVFKKANEEVLKNRQKLTAKSAGALEKHQLLLDSVDSGA